MKGGLKELPIDDRDFKVGQLFTLPKLEDLPKDFLLTDKLYIKNQGSDDTCAAQASCGASELQEDEELNPYWTFAKSKEMTGDLDEWGQDLRSICKVHTKFGAISIKDNDTRSRDIKDFPVLNGIRHAKASYMKVEGVYDVFDDIRATIWKFRSEKRAVVFGIRFGFNKKDIILDYPKDGYGHSMYCIGWKTIDNVPYLVVVNSLGKEAGDNGIHYIGRQVINEDVPKFGAYMFMDKLREDIELMIETNSKFDGEPYSKILKSFWIAIKELFNVNMLTKEEKVEVAVNLTKEIAKEVNIVNKLTEFCLAIQEYEGYIPPNKKYPKGTPAWRNNNPGNIKGIDGNFLKFKSYEEGFEYLKKYVLRVVRNEHRAYPKDCNVKQFFNVYAPSSDNNNPHLYAQFVAKKIDVKIDAKLKDFIS